MALGSFNNNKKSSSTELTVYSNLKMNNIQSEVDKTSLSFSFWNNLLGINLAPVITAADGSISYDRENSITIWLSATKAFMLSREISRFLRGEAKNVGVHTRAGIINITTGIIIDGSEYGSAAPCITIRKIDADGQITSAYTYETRIGYHYSIDNFEERKSAAPIFEKHCAYDTIELELIQIQCDEYVKSMAMAQAYAVTETVARQIKRLDFKLNKIGEAQGLSFDYNNGGSNKSSYFDTYGNNDNLANTDNDDLE